METAYRVTIKINRAPAQRKHYVMEEVLEDVIQDFLRTKRVFKNAIVIVQKEQTNGSSHHHHQAGRKDNR